MKNRYFALTKSLLLVGLPLTYLLIGCGGNKREKDNELGDGRAYTSVFGERYSALGEFVKNDKDSVETKRWNFVSLDTSLFIFGDYSDGLLTGPWTFIFSEPYVVISNWMIYKNRALSCEFSIPFPCTDTLMARNIFKLTNRNDSTGKVSILVNVRDTLIRDTDLAKYGPDNETGLREQGYTYKPNRREIRKNGLRYFLTEYYMKNAANKDVKLYDLYGYLPSKKRLVSFTLFHDGPKEDWVKVMYNLMATSLYVEGERFFNPYIN